MLSTRQFKILYHLYSSRQEDPAKSFSIDDLAETYGVTTRTIRTDVDAIAKHMAGKGLDLSIDKKDVVLSIVDADRARYFVGETMDEMQKVFYFVDDLARAKYIVETVLLSRRYVSMDTLAGDLYISQSRLSQDLKTVGSILEKYHLTLERAKGVGVRITGDPLDKRDCLMKESSISLVDDVQYIGNSKYDHMLDMSSDIVTSIMLRHDFSVSDITLQNIVVHVAATVEMLIRGSVIEEDLQPDPSTDPEERVIAREILERCSDKFGLSFNDNEVENLAVNIHGKREYDTDDFITSKVDEHVLNGLKRVSDVYGIDLTENLDLRIALALHVNPMVTRLKHHRQLENALTFFIKQNYALPFEIATTFADEALPVFEGKISDDELSYLACHFATALNAINEANHAEKRAIIITRSKKSEALLLKQSLRSRFPQIAQVDVSHVYSQKKLNLNEYDCILVTEKDLTSLNSNCIYVDGVSLDEDEERRVAFSLAGFDLERDLVSKFDRRLFEVGSANSKEEIVRRMFSRAQDLGIVDPSALDSILEHERSNSSYFGNDISIPHAETLRADCRRTFISVFILNKKVPWDSFKTDMSLLLVINVGDSVRYQLWNYISLMISKPEYIASLRSCRDFQSFINAVRSIFKLEIDAR